MDREFTKLPGRNQDDVAFYEGYQNGHRDTLKMLSRRALAYLFVGGFAGAACMFLVVQSGVLADLTQKPAVIEDPALSTQKPKEYVKAIAWAKRFTVGIIAEQPGRRGEYYEVTGGQHIGSGIVLNEQGYVLTNSHVIPESTSRLEVVLGEKAYEARFVGRRAEYDIAIIKINAQDLIPATFGDSEKVEQGDICLAIGSPYGLFYTATDGIVSAVGRQGDFGSLVPNYIQTSAAINGGNSGGPLIDITGRVIGINTLKIVGGQNGAADNISFAIPSTVAKRVSELILRGDDPREDLKLSGIPRELRGALLGVVPEDGLRTELPGDGVIVREVIAGGAADNAGLRPGDKITQVGDKKVVKADQLRAALIEMAPGAEIEVKYVRDGKPGSVKVVLGGRNR
ncbi:MAG: trypsin-like peptidase domain-containing protein [Planctomycetes bacterium]|nr:trypsin-like peptidase domain-containing protein [Planctomycetota bacterium]